MTKAQANLRIQILCAYTAVTMFCTLIIPIEITSHQLHAARETNAALTRKLPAIQQRIQAEPDPEKLRADALAWLAVTVDASETQQTALGLIIKMSDAIAALFLVSLLIVTLAILRLQRLSREG